VGCVQARVNEWSLSTLPSPIPELQHAPLPLKVLWARERAPTPPYFDVFYLGSHLSPLRSWECVTWLNLTNLIQFFFFKLLKDENFVCVEYIWSRIIPIIKFEKWKIYFKNEIIGDSFVWNYRWKLKWCKKRQSTSCFENYCFCLNILVKNMIFQCW